MSTPHLPLSAVVLAAGRSTRMGRDKALLEWEGVPLWRRQRDLLASAGATEIFLSARPEQTWARALVFASAMKEIGTLAASSTSSGAEFAAVVHDAFTNGGPLVGITAALERASFGHLAVLAVDLPRMDADWFRALREICAPGVGAVGRRGEFFEPLAAIYPRELKWAAWEALVRGEYALQSLLRRAVGDGLMRVHGIAPDSSEAKRFENWNEPRLF